MTSAEQLTMNWSCSQRRREVKIGELRRMESHRVSREVGLGHEFGKMSDSLSFGGEVFCLQSEDQQFLLRIFWPLNQQTKPTSHIWQEEEMENG